jgi:hypothetical protein
VAYGNFSEPGSARRKIDDPPDVVRPALLDDSPGEVRHGACHRHRAVRGDEATTSANSVSLVTTFL